MDTTILNIFKVSDECINLDINAIINNKMNDKKIENIKRGESNFQSGINNYTLNFFFGYRKNLNGRIDWYEKLKDIFLLEDERKISTSAYGILVIEGNLNKVNQENGKIELDRKIKYIITFGYGNNIVSDIVDLNYGLEMASMMAKIDSINTQSSKFFSLNKSKSLIIYNNANFNTQVGEAVDYLTAEIEEYSHRSSVKNLLQLINKNVIFSIYVKITLNKEFSFENIIKIINNLDNIYNTYEHRLSIPKLAYLTQKNATIIETLDKKVLKEAIEDDENTRISIGTYTNLNGDIKIISDIESVTLSCKRKQATYNELNITNVKEFIKENNITNIKNIKISTEQLGKDDLYKYIDYTTQLEDNNEYYCLSNGRWTKFNKEYIKKVEEEIKKRVCKITEYLDEYKLENIQDLRKKYSNQITGKNYKNTDKMNNALYEERIYNMYIAEKTNGIVYDRKTTDTIEISDIYTKDTHELIHTKIGEPGKFIECINQSIYGTRHYINNKQEVIRKLGNKIEKIETITLLLVITNDDVWKNKDISRFKSLRFKLNLLEWINNVEELNFRPRIIITKKASKKKKKYKK